MTTETETDRKVHIRWMIRRDVPDVLKIEKDGFAYAWTEEDFLQCLRQRNSIGMVAEDGEEIVGFMIYELHKTRLHLVNFAVALPHRMTGIGSQMVEKLYAKLLSHRREKITLCVREGNLNAQLFFRATGFIAEEVKRGYYKDSNEDAYLMARYVEPEYETPTAEG